jgi:hypothetical protein
VERLEQKLARRRARQPTVIEDTSTLALQGSNDGDVDWARLASVRLVFKRTRSGVVVLDDLGLEEGE